jgi:Zn-dependent M16 (insulinase) family peptidase
VSAKDFANNLPIVLDLCFHSILTEKNFLSECHRYEFEDNDPANKLRHNGVVYNEVLAEFLNREELHSFWISEHLFPDSIQRFRYDGDEAGLMNVTLDVLEGLYRRNYTPSNALFQFYGSFDPLFVLETVSATLDPIPYRQVSMDLRLFEQRKWSEPRFLELEGPLDDESLNLEDQYTVLVSWYVCDLTEWEVVLDCCFVASLLMESAHSVFDQVLVKTGLARQLCCSGLDQNSLLCSFTIGADGIRQSDTQKVIDLIGDTLNSVSATTIDEEMKKAVLNSFLLDMRLPQSNDGREIFDRIANEWSFGMDPFDLIDLQSEIDILKRHHETARYFEDFIVERLVNNPHRLTIVVKPTPGYIQKFNRDIATRLELKKSSLTEEDVAKIVSDYQLVHDEEEDDADTIPEFQRVDLDLEGDFTLPTFVSENRAVFVLPTRGTTTFRLQCRFRVSPEDLTIFRLICSVIGGVGAGDRDDVAFSLWEDIHCSGFVFWLSDIETPIQTPDDFPVIEIINVACLDDHIGETVEMFGDLLFRPRFDNIGVIERELKKLLQSECRGAKDDAAYAIRRAQVGFGRVANYGEVLAGFTFIANLRKIVGEGDFAAVGGQIAGTFERIVRSASFVGTIHCSTREQAERASAPFVELIRRLNARGASAVCDVAKPLPMAAVPNVYFEFPNATSSIVAVSVSCQPFADNGLPTALAIMESLLMDVLFSHLRDEQGVYSFQVYYKEFECTFSIATTCDPSPKLTPSVIRKEIEEIADGNIEEDVVNRAVVRSFAVMDRPRKPQSKGWEPYCRGWSKEWMQERRGLMYNITKERIVAAAKYLLDRQWHCCIVSNRAIADVPDDFVLQE